MRVAARRDSPSRFAGGFVLDATRRCHRSVHRDRPGATRSGWGADGAGVPCKPRISFTREPAAAHSPWGLSTFLMSPRTPLSRSSAGEERGLVNSPDAMRSSRVLARHGVATRRRESLTPAAPLLLCNDSDPRPRIARPAPRLEREDADGVTRARPTEGAAVASDAYIIWKVALSESQPPSRGWMWFLRLYGVLTRGAPRLAVCPALFAFP